MYDVNLSWLSSHTLNQRVASLLNITCSLPPLIFVSRSYLLNRCRCNFENSTASVFALSYVTAFSVPHSNIVFAPSLRIFPISFIELPDAINPRSSTNDNDVTDGVIF